MFRPFFLNQAFRSSTGDSLMLRFRRLPLASIAACGLAATFASLATADEVGLRIRFGLNDERPTQMGRHGRSVARPRDAYRRLAFRQRGRHRRRERLDGVDRVRRRARARQQSEEGRRRRRPTSAAERPSQAADDRQRRRRSRWPTSPTPRASSSTRRKASSNSRSPI